ncbi:hypothetical protein ACFWUT_02230 [Streptomyces cyaneofuscatus]|uniref:hypothetical protein n=1 Tax=Streptomyces cyaneofuscatus TaxID=66883 RepID=UPI003658619A
MPDHVHRNNESRPKRQSAALAGFICAAARSFSWRLMLACGDPKALSTHFVGFGRSHVGQISCPGDIAFDEHGNLWLAIDGAACGTDDGLFVGPGHGAATGPRGQPMCFLRSDQFRLVPLGWSGCVPLDLATADAVRRSLYRSAVKQVRWAAVLRSPTHLDHRRENTPAPRRGNACSAQGHRHRQGDLSHVVTQ